MEYKNRVVEVIGEGNSKHYVIEFTFLDEFMSNPGRYTTHYESLEKAVEEAISHRARNKTYKRKIVWE